MNEKVEGRGPCQMCGAVGYALSMGGPSICPACDCGINPQVSRLQRELAETRAELIRMAREHADYAEIARNAVNMGKRLDTEIHRAERAESALAELRAKVESAPTQVYGRDDWHEPFIGKRVRLLLDEGQ